MKYYESLLKKGCFTYQDVCILTGNSNTADSILRSYLHMGYIMKIKRGLFVAIDLRDGEPAANKFVIAGKLTGNSYVSHFSAFEYYGYTNQHAYEMYVTSDTKFNTLEFNGITYKRLSSNIKNGVITFEDNVRVTDIERTILDGINDFEHVMGFEELLRCIGSVPLFDEAKMLRYLKEYDKQFLYQKTGFILEHFRDELNISKDFLAECINNIGKSSRYLMSDKSKTEQKFILKWHLIVPEKAVEKAIGNGGEDDADI